MRLILQRVKSAHVDVGGERIATIGQGLLVLMGVEVGDGADEVQRAAQKLAHLRAFEDSEGRMNLDLSEVEGEILLVSQFTLAASLRKGRRPSFDKAAAGPVAEPLVEALAQQLREMGVQVSTGRFGAHMEVGLVNDGPVTFILDIANCKTG